MTAVVPADPAISDDEGSDEENNDVADPDFIPLTHECRVKWAPLPRGSVCGLQWRSLRTKTTTMRRRRRRRIKTAPQAKGPTKKGKPASRLTTWKKVDLDNQALPKYQHVPPDFIETPYTYFSKYFSPRVNKHIAYQTNLYATQKYVNNTFTTTEDEVRKICGHPALHGDF